MKNSILVLAAVAFMFTSCQKEDVVAQAQNVGEASLEIFNVVNMFTDVTEETVQSEACESVNAVETQVSLSRIDIHNGYIKTYNVSGNIGDITRVYFELIEEYRVENEAEDGGGYYYTKALRLYEGDTITDNYVLLLDFCEEDRMTFFFTETNEMIYTARQ